MGLLSSVYMCVSQLFDRRDSGKRVGLTTYIIMVTVETFPFFSTGIFIYRKGGNLDNVLTFLKYTSEYRIIFGSGKIR